jgi:hypothetical protein
MGISPVEFRVLKAFAAHPELSEHLTEYVQWSSYGEEKYTQEGYEISIKECFAKGWITILNELDCERERNRWRSDPVHCEWEYRFVPDMVDLTPEGWQRFYKVLATWYRRGATAVPYDILQCSWQQPNVVSLYYPDLRGLQSYIRLAQEGDLELWDGVGFTFQIEKVSEPHEIGEWWYTRFMQWPEGYCADVAYPLHPIKSEADSRVDSA